MLSILIPNYNYEVGPLLEELLQQMEAENIALELICMDDGSTAPYLQQLIDLPEHPFLQKVFLEKNIGRAAIRNRLAQMASQPYLLYLDADSWPSSPNFLAQYLNHLGPWVLVGGREYAPTCPAAKFSLHWTYGRSREVRSLAARQAQPYASFMSNNFALPKAWALAQPFEEQLKQYGHEDSLWGWQLAQEKKEIRQIDNAVIHLGLDDNAAFLAKSKQAVENLHFLSTTAAFPMLDDIKLWRVWKKVQFFAPLLAHIHRIMHKNWEKQLFAPQPSLKLFDFYRLSYLALYRQTAKNKTT